MVRGINPFLFRLSKSTNTTIIKKHLIILICSCFFSLSAQYHKGHYLQEGRFELGQKNYAKAIEKLSIAIGFEPRWYDAYFYRAVAKFELDDYKGAEEDFSVAINLYPYDFRYFLYRGIIRSRTYNYRGAFWDYERALDIDTSIAEIYMNRAVLSLSLGKLNDALRDCKKAKQLKYKEKDLFFVRGTALQEKGLFRGAISDFNEVLKVDTANIEALIRRGVTNQSLEVLDSALMDFEMVLKLDSNHVLGYFHRGNWELKNKHYKKAIQDYNTSISISDKNSAVFFNRAIAKDNLDDHQGAIEDFSRVLEMNPNNITAYYNRAGIHFRSGRNKMAVQDFSAAIAIYPKYADAYYARSQVFGQMKRVKESEEDYRMAMVLKEQGHVLAENVGLFEASRLKKATELSNDFRFKEEEKKLQYKVTDIEFSPIFILGNNSSAKETPYAYETRSLTGKRQLFHFIQQRDVIGSLDSVQAEIWYLDSLIQLHPERTENYLQKGILQARLASFQQAFVSFNQALLLEPDNFKIWFSKANARLLLARQLFANIPEKGSIGFNEKSEDQQRVLAKHYALLIEDYNKALELEPQFVFGWYNRSYAHALSGNSEAALRDLTQCIKIDPNFLEAYYNRGLLTLLFTDKGTGCNDLSRAGELGMTSVYNIIKRFCNN